MHAIADQADKAESAAPRTHGPHRSSNHEPPPREDVLVRRTVMVEAIPSGAPIEPGRATGADHPGPGRLVHAAGGRPAHAPQGADADAIGKPTASSPRAHRSARRRCRTLVWDTLRTCYDPEIPVNIVDLGLVYRCALEPLEDSDKLRVVIDMTLTAPGCGMGEAIAEEVCDKLLLVPRVGSVTVNMVFDPPWTRAMMSGGGAVGVGVVSRHNARTPPCIGLNTKFPALGRPVAGSGRPVAQPRWVVG